MITKVELSQKNDVCILFICANNNSSGRSAIYYHNAPQNLLEVDRPNIYVLWYQNFVSTIIVSVTAIDIAYNLYEHNCSLRVKFGGLRSVHLPSTLILPHAGFPVSSTFVPSSPASTYVVHLSSAYTGGTASLSLLTDFQEDCCEITVCAGWTRYKYMSL